MRVLLSGQAGAVQSEDTAKLSPITEFGANRYTEKEKRSLSELVALFNERHGGNLTEEDAVRLERVQEEIMDAEMTEMMRNNPVDVVYGVWERSFVQGMVRMFQRDSELRSALMTDKVTRDQATRHFFNRAIRMANENRV